MKQSEYIWVLVLSDSGKLLSSPSFIATFSLTNGNNFCLVLTSFFGFSTYMSQHTIDWVLLPFIFDSSISIGGYPASPNSSPK